MTSLNITIPSETLHDLDRALYTAIQNLALENSAIRHHLEAAERDQIVADTLALTYLRMQLLEHIRHARRCEDRTGA